MPKRVWVRVRVCFQSRSGRLLVGPNLGFSPSGYYEIIPESIRRESSGHHSTQRYVVCAKTGLDPGPGLVLFRFGVRSDFGWVGFGVLP